MFSKNLAKLKKLDVSFNKLEGLPEMNETNNDFEFLDISHNNIEKLDVRSNNHFCFIHTRTYTFMLFILILELLLMKKLVNMNLSHNLLVDLKELYSLKNLQFLTQVCWLEIRTRKDLGIFRGIP